MWPYTEADGKIPTSTPAKLGNPDEMDRLEKVQSRCHNPGGGRGETNALAYSLLALSQFLKKHQRGEMDRIDWLDQAAMQAIAVVKDV